ncbi:hypothetical protein WJX73_005450 [Symbiochloris irregularis]|uniref:TRUD domain-containing protein n=1 Tax=Symbiochloris irregularis TaxID=706552 RepID=A0AAW1NTC8_9CHLO
MPASEADVGILGWANTAKGFSAILKQRYSDFQVNEIDGQGRVVHLTKLTADNQTVASQNGTVAHEPSAPPEQPSAASHEAPLPIASNLPEAAVIEVEGASKAKRTAVHAFFRRSGMPRVETESIRTDGKQARSADGLAAVQGITVSYQPAAMTKRKRGRHDSILPSARNMPWEGGDKTFLRFTLAKENLDSHACLSLLSRLLHVPASAFAVAGTKDKRGVTVQQVTANKISPERLASLNATLRGIKLGDFEYADAALFLGAAKGNHFDIILRDAQGEEGPQGVLKAAEALKSSGFINYFGLQRFGSGSVPTHRVGALLLKGDWAGVVNLIMAPHADDREDNAAARRLYTDKGDLRGALRAMPKHLTAEKAILEGLLDQKGKGTKDLVAVLGRIPRNLRSIGVDESLAAAELASVGDEGVSAEAAPAPENVPKSSLQAHTVTAEEAASRQYSMEDVVLPLPGRHISYPSNGTAQVYQDLCSKDGLSLHDSSPHGIREYSLSLMPGAYRRLLVRPADLSWQLLRYSDADTTLAVTALDRATQQNAERKLACSIVDPGTPITTSPGELYALRLQVSLPTAAYATMLVRELTKQSTATAVHRARTLAVQPAANGEGA